MDEELPESCNRNRIFYRIGQFWEALRTSPLNEHDLDLARSVLTDSQMVLFRKLQSSEQAHSIRLLNTLKDQGESHPDLLAAALLHDIGKVCHPLRLWERVLIVLVKQVAPDRLVEWGQGDPKGWKRPFVISNKHAKWGAELVSQTGASPLLQALIQEHDTNTLEGAQGGIKARLLTALREVDDRN